MKIKSIILLKINTQYNTIKRSRILSIMLSKEAAFEILFCCSYPRCSLDAVIFVAPIYAILKSAVYATPKP